MLLKVAIIFTCERSFAYYFRLLLFSSKSIFSMFILLIYILFSFVNNTFHFYGNSTKGWDSKPDLNYNIYC